MMGVAVVFFADSHSLLCSQASYLLVQISPSNDPAPVREPGVLGPFHFEHEFVSGVGAQTGDLVKFGNLEIETHVQKLADRSRGQTIATRLVPRILLLLDEQHVMTGNGEPMGG